MNKKSAAEWLELENHIEVMDPDGWRNAHIAWETPITYKQFKQFVAESTIRIRGGFPDRIPAVSKYEFEDDYEALEVLRKAGCTIVDQTITRPVKDLDDRATSALYYLCDNWDYSE